MDYERLAAAMTLGEAQRVRDNYERLFGERDRCFQAQFAEFKQGVSKLVNELQEKPA